MRLEKIIELPDERHPSSPDCATIPVMVEAIGQNPHKPSIINLITEERQWRISDEWKLYAHQMQRAGRILPPETKTYEPENCRTFSYIFNAETGVLDSLSIHKGSRFSDHDFRYSETKVKEIYPPEERANLARSGWMNRNEAKRLNRQVEKAYRIAKQARDIISHQRLAPNLRLNERDGLDFWLRAFDMICRYDYKTCLFMPVK